MSYSSNPFRASYQGAMWQLSCTNLAASAFVKQGWLAKIYKPKHSYKAQRCIVYTSSDCVGEINGTYASGIVCCFCYLTVIGCARFRRFMTDSSKLSSSFRNSISRGTKYRCSFASSGKSDMSRNLTASFSVVIIIFLR